jgi:hypothetical protein
MEVGSLSDLVYTIPTGTTGSIEYSGNTIPIEFLKGNGQPYSYDVLTLYSDNISSGRRRLGMVVYVYDNDQFYQFNINGYTSLFNAATASTNCVTISEYGTLVKNNTIEGQNFINAWTASTIEDISGYTYENAVWRKFPYLSISGGTLRGGLVANSGLTANTISQVNYIDFDTTPNVPNPTGGTLFYDSVNNALAYRPVTNNNDVTIQIGQESVTRIYNDTGVQINNGQALFITGGTSGASTVTLAIASGGGNMYYQVDGVATHDIPNGEFGFMSAFGSVRDLNLSAFTLGEDIFLSETTPGAFSSFSALTYTGRTSQIGHVITTGSSGTLQLNINNEPIVGLLTATENNVLVGGNASTGTYSFTGISIETSTTINISPVNGWIVSNTGEKSINPSILSIVYPGQTGVTLTNLATADATYILLTSAVTITQQTTFPTPQERRESIFLGKVVHPSRTSILAVNNTVDYSLSVMSSLRDLWSPLRLINDGVIPSANGSNMSFNVSSGTLWGNGINWVSNQLNPNNVSLSAKTPASFFYRTQTGGTSGSVSVIDPTSYDLNGVITTITPAPSDKATNQRIYQYPTGVLNVLYGQTVYDSLTEAVAGIQSEVFTVYPNAATTAILIGILSVRNDTALDGQGLNNPSYALFTPTSKFGELLGGTGGLSTTTLQQAYDNSTEPEILINAILDGLSIQNGTGNPDNTTQLLQGKNTAADLTSFIRADGLISGSTLSTPGFNANSNGLTATTISATTVSIGSPSTSSAILEVASTSQGVLFPRMTQTQRTSISSPTAGLIVYQTDSPDGLYIYKVGGWVQII